jgi:hypothetical protein
METVKRTLDVLTLIHCAVKDDTHPNKMKFKGVLLMLDEPSTKPPNGSRGHRIQIDSAVAKKRLHTLVGMGINYKDSLDAHAPQNKVGVIDRAWVSGKQLWVEGTIWKRDFPEAEKDLKKKDLGMSFEAADITVEDVNATVWNLIDFHFTGATILYRDAAAYFDTTAKINANAVNVINSMAASAETTKHIFGGTFMSKKIAEKGATVSASTIPTWAKKLIDTNTLIAQGQTALTEAITRMAAASEETATLLKTSVLANGMGDEDEMESEADAVSAGRKKKDDGDDDDDDEPEEDDESDDEGDDDDVDAAGSDDEDEFEDMEDDIPLDEDDKGGHFNSDIDTDKPMKAKPSTRKDKNKNLPSKIAASKKGAVISRSSYDLAIAQNKRLHASIQKLKKRSRITASKLTEKLEAAASQVDRRSMAIVSVDAQTKNLLKKGGLDVTQIHAAGSKVSIDEIDAALDTAKVIDPIQRMAMKIKLSRADMLEEEQAG